MNRTKIEWSQFTSNPIRAFSLVDPTKKGHHCKKISPGCAHCYSDHLQASMYFGLPPFDKQFLNENVGIYLDENELQRLLKRRKPATVFLGDMTDTFGDWVPFEWLDKIFAVAALTPHITYQILTKRAKRMREYFCGAAGRIGDAMQPLRTDRRAVGPSPHYHGGEIWYPIENVHLGVSVENPDYLWRLDHLRETPAAVRFASLEPLLADLGDISEYLKWLSWVIAGGESGPGARPMYPDWVRSIRDQCVAAGVPFFFKQWGRWAPPTKASDEELACMDRSGRVIWGPHSEPLLMPVGKKAAGRLLDGREWNEMPVREMPR